MKKTFVIDQIRGGYLHPKEKVKERGESEPLRQTQRREKGKQTGGGTKGQFWGRKSIRKRGLKIRG